MLYLSAQSFASCTPTFRRPPRSLLLPTNRKAEEEKLVGGFFSSHQQFHCLI